MTENMKKTIQAELYRQLVNAWVLCSLDVECVNGKDSYRLDVALHTRSFIFGRIDVCPDLPVVNASAMVKRYGIEQRCCNSLEDIEECVRWAVDLQERHIHSQVVSKVA